MSKRIKTRSDLLNFVLETRYVEEVFEREPPKPLPELEKKDEKELRAHVMSES